MNSEHRKSTKAQLALALAQGVSAAQWARTNNVPKVTASWWAKDPSAPNAVESYRGGLRAQGGGGLLGDIGENVTNEANLCENTSTSENHESVWVTANFDVLLGLDKLETKPAGAWSGDAVSDGEEEAGDDVSGGDGDEEVGMCRTEVGFGGRGGGGLLADIGENVTNEANLCENASTSENHESVRVTANSDGVLGLDNLETKPAGDGFCERNQTRNLNHGDHRDRWSGELSHAGEGPLAIEDTGQGTSATQTKTLVGGPGALGWKTTRDRRHWSGDQCHPEG